LALTEIHRALELAPNEAALHETLALLEVGDSGAGRWLKTNEEVGRARS
jgi:hypothetical protein